MPANDSALHKIAWQLRREVLQMVYEAQSGHLASALGLAEIFAVLYFGKILSYDPQRPKWDKRDYFFLSNGHVFALLDRKSVV